MFVSPFSYGDLWRTVIFLKAGSMSYDSCISQKLACWHSQRLVELNEEEGPTLTAGLRETVGGPEESQDQVGGHCSNPGTRRQWLREEWTRG